MAGESFGAAHARFRADIREDGSKSVGFGSISSRGGCSVRVDIIDVGGGESGVFEAAGDRIGESSALG